MTSIDPTHHEAMNLVARNLDDQFNPLRHMTGKRVTGFMLTVFDFDNPDGRFNYISNADKLDVRRMLQDVLARLDSRVGEDTANMVVVSRDTVEAMVQVLRAYEARAGRVNDWKLSELREELSANLGGRRRA